jgi:hypothetical protein
MPTSCPPIRGGTKENQTYLCRIGTLNNPPARMKPHACVSGASTRRNIIMSSSQNGRTPLSYARWEWEEEIARTAIEYENACAQEENTVRSDPSPPQSSRKHKDVEPGGRDCVREPNCVQKEPQHAVDEEWLSMLEEQRRKPDEKNHQCDELRHQQRTRFPYTPRRVSMRRADNCQ